MHHRKVTVVVIEAGASWPRWLHPWDSGDFAVVTQQQDGQPGELVNQVGHRLSGLAGKGWQIDGIVLVTNGRTDPATETARSVVARGLMAQLRSSGGVHFTLSVNEELGRRAANSLTALGTTLDSLAFACGVELAIRIGDKPPLYSRPPSAQPMSATG